MRALEDAGMVRAEAAASLDFGKSPLARRLQDP